MPNKNKFRGKNKRADKKAQKKKAKQEDKLSEGSLDDEHLYFDEEFVAPEGEDLDEPDDFELERLREIERQEAEAEEMEGEEDFQEEQYDDEQIEGEEQEPSEGGVEIRRIPINEERLSRVIAQCEAHSRKALKMFLKIFRSAINQGTEDDEEQKTQAKNPVEYEVEDGTVYNQVISYALTKVPHVLQYHLKNVTPVEN